jgi:thioredoxin 1
MLLYRLTLLFAFSFIYSSVWAQNEALSVDEFQRNLKDESEILVLDFQSEHNFKRGHIKKSKNIPFDSEKFESEINRIAKLDDKIFFYCTTDEENIIALQYLKEIGYQQIKYLKGGFVTWQSKSKPYSSSIRNLKPYTNLNYDNLKAILTQNEFIFVDFYADWCKPCKKMNPILKEIGENDPEIKIIKVNADESSELINHYGVEEIPTYLFFKNRTQVWRYTGEISKNELVEIIEKLKQ